MGQGANFCGQGVAPFKKSLAGALLVQVMSVVYKCSLCTVVKNAE